MFAGCSPRESSEVTDIQGPLSEMKALYWANVVANREGGFITRINPDHMYDSMGQSLSKNSWIVLKYSWDDIEVGDVISFRRGDGWILHEVILKSESGDAVRTKGSNNKTADETVFQDNYRGTMILQVYYRKNS